MDQQTLRFSWEISLGNLLSIATVAAAAFRWHRDWIDLVHEHKLMWGDFCRRHHLSNDPDFKDSGK